LDYALASSGMLSRAALRRPDVEAQQSISWLPLRWQQTGKCQNAEAQAKSEKGEKLRVRKSWAQLP
jgi:hypothetical protein